MTTLVLMGGPSAKIPGDETPAYLQEVNGRLVLEELVGRLRCLNSGKTVFCIRQDDAEKFQLANIIRHMEPSNSVVVTRGDTRGAVCTALLACDEIDDDGELVVVSVSDMMDANVKEIVTDFRSQHADAGCVTFPSMHPRYSFIRVDERGHVVECAEKRPISKDALASFYYFKTASLFKSCAKEVIRKDNPVNGRFYLSQVLNEVILGQGCVCAHHLEPERFHSLKECSQIAAYVADAKR